MARIEMDAYTLANHLRVAADQYDKDAQAIATEPGHASVAAQFNKQAYEAREMAEALESCACAPWLRRHTQLTKGRDMPHTPGPWVVDECPSALGFYTIRRADDSKNGDTEEPVVATVYTRADAHVVAASRDLLSAVRNLLRGLNNLGLYPGSDEAVNGGEVVDFLQRHLPGLMDATVKAYRGGP